MTHKIPEPISQEELASDEELRDHAPQSLITYQLFVAAQAMSRLVDASVKASLGLTIRQWRILVILNHLGTATSGEVARTAGYDHSQVSRIAAELTNLELAQQRMDGKDRRKQLLSLTEKGIQIVRRGLPASALREHRLRSRLSDAEYETFCRALALLTEETNAMLAAQDRSRR